MLEIILHTDDVLMALVAKNILYAYLILFLIIFLENGLIIFPFLPGDGLLFSAGVVAASTDINVWILLVILIISAVLGNLLNYYIGNVIGSKIIVSDNKFVKKHVAKQLPQTQSFYNKYGSNALIFGRFLPIVRTYIPFFAGIAKMKKAIFIKFSIIGAIIWVSIFLLIGFSLGEITWVKSNYGIIFLFLICITIIPLLISIVRRLFSKLR